MFILRVVVVLAIFAAVAVPVYAQEADAIRISG
jgi:Tfp pilus assembly protein PilE